MTPYRVRAYNRSHDSENKIHDDQVARRYGFTGALVPGVEVYAYLMHAPVERWGREFLERGAAKCRFVAPVYDGEEVEIASVEREGVFELEARSRGQVCATGSASLPGEGAAPGPETASRARPPARDARPEASEESLPVGGALAALPYEASDASASEYLRDVRETDGLYARERLVHPGLVLRMCNRALLESVRLGPWIHVASEVRNLSAARVGETLEARACVTGNYERKGHRFVEFDAMVIASGRPAARVRHTAIYRPRQSAAA
jgi:acyl dehydratase